MADRRSPGMLRQVGDAVRAAAPDAALLAWFAADRDEGAFAELVRRHGPAVLGVCRRALGHHDAEDAFQAVFLILATKGGRLARPELLGGWLYGVAVRVARRARRGAARRRRREVQVAAVPEPAADEARPAAEWSGALDEALAALPDRFRAAVLLCDLDGLSRAEAAARLGIPEGTLSSRLSAARKKLADRLGRRGLAAVSLAGAAVSPELAGRALATAVAGIGGGPVPADVRSLAAGGGLTMRKLIGWAVVSAAVTGLAVGAVAARPGADAEPPKPPAKGAEPKPDPAAPPAPKTAADGDKPARPGKPRLLRTFEISARPDMPIWSPDGDLVAVEESGGGVAVYDARTPAFRAAAQLQPLGFLAGKPTLVTYRAAPGRINAENALMCWDVPGSPPANAPPRDRVPHATLSRKVEYDLSDGTPFAVLPDGKAVLTLAVTSRRSKSGVLIGGSAVIRLLDAATGQVVRELARVEGDLHTVDLSPDGKALAVVYDRLGEPEDPTRPVALPSRTAVVESIDVPGGKRRWSREVPGWRKSGSPYTLRAAYSPDRKWLAVTLQEAAKERQRPITFGTIRLLDAATGEDGHRLEDQGGMFNTPMSFSHDGRLLVGYVRGEDQAASLRVWDVPTGRLLKSWDGTALAAFAPDRPVLAVLEDVSDGRTNPPRAVLGFWDLSALRK